MEKLETNRRRLSLPLPQHIFQVIFSKLALSNLLACRFVCKTWNRLILDYYSSSKSLFPNAFLLLNSDFDPNRINFESSVFSNPKMHYIDFDTLTSVASYGFEGCWTDISIANSCHGLLFICKCTNDTWCKGILNPMTNEFFKLSGSELEEEDIYVYGFGFSRNTKQYKLFRVLTEQSTCIMEIFTFGRNTGTNHNHIRWRPVSLPFPICLCYHGAYLDGIIYWIGRDKENEFVIYSLDVETQKIQLSAVLGVGPFSRSANIQPFNGTIYASIFMQPSCRKIQLWRMQGEIIFIRDFVICDIPIMQEYFHLVEAFEDGEILFLYGDDFFRVDKTGKKIKIKSFHSNPNVKKVIGACHIDSLHCGPLSNILGIED